MYFCMFFPLKKKVYTLLSYAQTPRYPDAQLPRYPDAQLPRFPDTQMPRRPDSQRPDSQAPTFPDAQVLTRQDTQVPRYLRIIKFFGWDFVHPKIEVGRNPSNFPEVGR